MKKRIIGALVTALAIGLIACAGEATEPSTPSPSSPTTAAAPTALERFDRAFCVNNPLGKVPTDVPPERAEFGRLMKRWGQGGLTAAQNDAIWEALDALPDSRKPYCER